MIISEDQKRQKIFEIVENEGSQIGGKRMVW